MELCQRWQTLPQRETGAWGAGLFPLTVWVPCYVHYTLSRTKKNLWLASQTHVLVLMNTERISTTLQLCGLTWYVECLKWTISLKLPSVRPFNLLVWCHVLLQSHYANASVRTHLVEVLYIWVNYGLEDCWEHTVIMSKSVIIWIMFNDIIGMATQMHGWWRSSHSCLGSFHSPIYSTCI